MTYKNIHMTFNIKRHMHARVIFRWSGTECWVPIASSALSAECIWVLKIYCALSAECTPDRALSVQVPSAAEHCVWAWWAGVYVTQVWFCTNVHICDTLAAGCAHMCICIYVCICMYMHMDAYVRIWYCLTRWGVVARIFYLCIRVHMHAYVIRKLRLYIYVG